MEFKILSLLIVTTVISILLILQDTAANVINQLKPELGLYALLAILIEKAFIIIKSFLKDEVKASLKELVIETKIQTEVQRQIDKTMTDGFKESRTLNDTNVGTLSDLTKLLTIGVDRQSRYIKDIEKKKHKKRKAIS